MFRSISALSLAVLTFLTAILFFLSCSDDGDSVEKGQEIFINELYASAGEDWIELYNASGSSKDISGYRIYDDEANKYTLPSGISIPGKGYLIILCDGTATGVHTNFQLASTGETVYLENASGEIIDQVEFPVLEDGQSYGRYPDGSQYLALSGSSTQGVSNGDNQAAVINSVSHSPVVPGLDDEVTVTAEVFNNSGITSVKLFYRAGSGSFTEKDMTTSSGKYQATIPVLNSTGIIQYYISVVNSYGMTTLHPFNAPDDTHEYILNTDPLPLLRINEFMASNTACCPDNDGGTDEFDDWIEIYNAGATAVNVGGMYVSDDDVDPFKNRISDSDPLKTTIEPGGFLLLWADEDGSQGPLHLNFKLSSSGEDVALFYFDGRTIDKYSFGSQQENRSYGLTQDGGSVWQVFAIPTPGASNE
jgi:hypothetical protein